MTSRADNDDSRALRASVVTVKETLDSGDPSNGHGTLPQLVIPNYQRPYSWGQGEVYQLLSDIREAMPKRGQSDDLIEYRVGTLITHVETRGTREVANIVDGQQRFLTFCLIAHALQKLNAIPPDLLPGLANIEVPNKEPSISNIHSNYSLIEDYFNIYASEPAAAREPGSQETEADDNLLTQFAEFFLNQCTVVVLRTHNIDSAFQMFDSQNTRGLALDATDLLKAFHLRALIGAKGSSRSSDNESEIKAAQAWESIEDVPGLFNRVLFRIKRWSRGEKAMALDFGTEHIDLFKGVDPLQPGEDVRDRPAWEHMALRLAGIFDDTAPVVNEQNEAKQSGDTLNCHSPIFQLTSPIVNGQHFFDMTVHYAKVRDLLLRRKEDEHHEEDGCLQCEFLKLYEEVTWGSRYTAELWHCLVVTYLDRFIPNNRIYEHQGDVVKQSNYLKLNHHRILRDAKILQKYAFLLHIELGSIRRESIDKHALHGHRKLNTLGRTFTGNIVQLIASAPHPSSLRKYLVPIVSRSAIKDRIDQNIGRKYRQDSLKRIFEVEEL